MLNIFTHFAGKKKSPQAIGEKNQRKQIPQKRGQRQSAYQSADETADRNRYNTAEKTEHHGRMLFFIHHAQRKRNRKGDRTSHHGGDNQRVEHTEIRAVGNLHGKRCAAHVVCENDGRQNRRINP